MTYQLKPCPFCGKNVEYHNSPISGEHIIECFNEECCFVSFWPVDWDTERVLKTFNTRARASDPVQTIPNAT